MAQTLARQLGNAEAAGRERQELHAQLLLQAEGEEQLALMMAGEEARQLQRGMRREAEEQRREHEAAMQAQQAAWDAEEERHRWTLAAAQEKLHSAWHPDICTRATVR